MKNYFNSLMGQISIETSVIDMEDCDISIAESVAMIELLKKYLSDLRSFFLSKESISTQEEITFFKEMKPEILGLLLYFNKIHNIELKHPTGRNDSQKEHLERELYSITYYFERHLDFYQYYRSKYILENELCKNLK